MTTRAAFAGMMQTLTVRVPQQNAEAARAAMAEAAARESARVISEQTARGGIAPTKAVAVDGRRGADPATVRPDGVVLLEWGYVREVALVALSALRQAGPRRSGDWAAGLTVLADGAEIDPEAIPHMAQTVHVVATVPYARRLEIGRTKSGHPFVVDDSDYRLIERTARRMAVLYRDVAKIDFAYVDLEDAYQIKGTRGFYGGYYGTAGASGAHRYRRRRTRRNAPTVRYPAIRILGWQVQ